MTKATGVPYATPMAARSGWLILLLCLVVGACKKDEATERCHAQMVTAKSVVKNIDSSSMDSVTRSLGAVESALAACKIAKRDLEVEQLETARDQIAKHKERLRRHISKKATAKLTREELEALVKNGDPSCPHGQAYKHRDSGQEVRCTGAQLITLNYATAKKFYSERGFKVTETETPPGIEAEYGSEKYIYEFDRKHSLRPPTCVVLYPPPGMSWQEAVTRTTGARPDQLTGKPTVDTPRGPVKLRVVETLHKLIVYLGQCKSR